ncbi:phosphoglucosamine mutase [Candidatus Saccharibacteria bacterium]|nr:phosphoglucosamine mutase [Candidatus Saccharibacteria bacterium]
MIKRIFRETDGIRGKVGEEPLTERSMRKLGRAIGEYFIRSDRAGMPILIGHDSRESGKWISRELAEGMMESDCDVWDIGEVSTPCMGILTGAEEVAGGVMVTASHNPASDNGVKVFDGRGDKLTDEEEIEIEKLFFEDSGGYPDQQVVGEVLEKSSLVDDYIELAMKGVDLSGMKICTDNAAGGGYGIVRKALEKVGATVVEVGPKPDGTNINEGCGALHPEKLAEAVVREGADMGVAFDGDGDRIIVVDDKGMIWDGDRITSMLAVWLKSEGKLAGDVVVMTEYSNLSAVQFLEKQGIRVDKVINGDRAVAAECKKIGAALGGEASGHIIYPEWLSASDGLFVATLVARMAHERGMKLSSLSPDYENYPSKLWNIDVKERKPLEGVKGWNEGLKRWQEYLGAEGRVFVRYSGTEDLLRILVEAKDAEKMKEAGDGLSEIVRKEIGK